MSASLIARLIEAGTPADLVAEVAIELARAVAARDAAEAKKAADRDRMRGKRAESRATSHVSRDIADVAEPPKNVPPHPPINTPLKNSEANASGAEAPIDDPSEAERELFVRGRRVLGKSAGGQISKLKAHFGGNVALARAAIETASTKQHPPEYVAAILRGGDPPSRQAPLTFDAETGAPIHDRQPARQNRSYPADRSQRPGAHDEAFAGLARVFGG